MAKRTSIIVHPLFWLIYILVGTVVDTLGNNQGVFALDCWVLNVTNIYFASWVLRSMVIFYVAFWYFERFFSIKNLLVHLLVSVSLAVLGVILRYVLNDFVIAPVINDWNWGKNISLGVYFGRDFIFEIMLVLCGFLMKSIHDFFRNENLKTEKVTMELAYLKSQINPHFLFNTMNNLYGLSLSEPEKTPDVILKISEMMRYMLYESNGERVALRREIEYLNSYIELEKIRFEGKTYVNFTIEGNINQYQIAPLLLISFVENIFKHGEIQNAQKPVEISLQVQGNQLIFRQKNAVAIREKDKMGGVGMQNVKRRLFLLYPNKHTLTVRKENGMYESELILEML
jgi:two-component system, LytTR family, sensor kinase